MKLISHSAAETQKIARGVAGKLPSPDTRNHPVVIALEGDLGAGKTTFTQGFAKALGIKAKVKSPTFLLMKEHHLKNQSFFHIDCYRVKTYKDLVPLEVTRIIKDPKNIVVVEWPERIKPILPKKLIRVRLKHVSENERSIEVTGL